MAAPKKSSTPSGKPIPIRLPDHILDGAAVAMKKTGRSQQETLRLASEIGLAALAQVDYDIPGIVAKFALEKADGADAAKRKLTVRLPTAKPGSSQPTRLSSSG